MLICIYICMYVNVNFKYIYIYIYIYVYFKYICIYIYFECIYIYVYVYIYMCIYICIYIHEYTYIYVYIHATNHIVKIFIYFISFILLNKDHLHVISTTMEQEKQDVIRCLKCSIPIINTENLQYSRRNYYDTINDGITRVSGYLDIRIFGNVFNNSINQCWLDCYKDFNKRLLGISTEVFYIYVCIYIYVCMYKYIYMYVCVYICLYNTYRITMYHRCIMYMDVVSTLL
jgi:hypothetical protein